MAGAEGQSEVGLYTPFKVPEVDPEAKVIGVVQAIARLADAATAVQAEVEATAHARAVGRPFADVVFGDGAPVEVRVRSMVEQMTANVRPALLLLVVGAGLVLAIACANVTNLLLSRVSTRAREFATRAALGADRRRLLQQVVTESVVFSLVGGVLGLFVGWVLTTPVRSLAPEDFPRLQAIRVDMWFLAAGGVVAVFVGSIVGVLPALRQTGVDLASAIQVGGIRSMGNAGRRLRETLVVAEVALAIVLLVGGALLARSFVTLLSVDAGFDAANVLVADIHVPEGSHQTRGEELGLCLPGRSEKIREVVCRFGAHVPIRAVWLARAADLAVRRRPGARVIRRTSASSNRTARSAGCVVNWRAPPATGTDGSVAANASRSNSTRRGGPAADRQPPLPRTGRKVAAGVPGGGLAHATVGRAAGRARNRSTRPSRRRRRRRVRTAAARLK